MPTNSVVPIGCGYLGDYTINVSLSQFSPLRFRRKTSMVMLFLDTELIGPVGMVTRSLLNSLGWVECITLSHFYV